MSTNPEAEVQLSPEDRLAGLFGANDEADEEPEQGDPDEADEVEAEDAEPEQEAEAEEEQPTEEAEEVEFEGKVYKLPKELKDAVLRQQDYTRKTQEVAEQRRVVEERTKFLDQMEQLRSEQFEQVVALQSLDQRIAAFESVNWDELARTDQTEFLRLERQQRVLEKQREGLREQLRTAATKQQSAVEQYRQDMLKRGAEELRRDIKGWSPELAREITNNAKNYSFTDEELAQISDPRFVKALHDAYQWRKLQAAKPGIEKRVANAKPVKAVSRSAPQAQRDAKAVAARESLKKSGKAADAEAFFESLFKRK